MGRRARLLPLALLAAVLSLAVVSGPADARVKYWHKDRAGFDSGGRTTLDYCAAVKRRTPERLVAAAGILGNRTRIPFRTWPRAGAGYPGLSYKWGPRFPFRDWWVITFRRDGRLRMSYESATLLNRVSRREFHRRCW